AVGRLERFRQADVRQQDAEFLAAVTADQVAFAHHRAQGFSHLLQHLVADAVSVGVIDRLEVVDVHHHAAEAVAIALRGSPARRAACRRRPGWASSLRIIVGAGSRRSAAPGWRPFAVRLPPALVPTATPRTALRPRAHSSKVPRAGSRSALPPAYPRGLQTP